MSLKSRIFVSRNHPWRTFAKHPKNKAMEFHKTSSKRKPLDDLVKAPKMKPWRFCKTPQKETPKTKPSFGKVCSSNPNKTPLYRYIAVQHNMSAALKLMASLYIMCNSKIHLERKLSRGNLSIVYFCPNAVL